MQFYSDYSSEEEQDDYEVDLWNPNELIDEILAVEDGEEKMKLKKALLQKFLDQDRPLLTSKMKEFFLEEGVTENLMSFVNRVHLEDEKMDSAGDQNANLAPAKTRPLNIPGQEDEVKRSFNVMEMFINPMHDLGAFLPEKLSVILRQLFKVFQPSSTGNFYHFNKIVEQLLIRTPSATTKVLLSEGLIWTMLDFLHETPIVDTLIEIFCVGFPRQGDTIHFYKSLIDNKMFERIGEKIYGIPSSKANFVADFFIKLMEKLSSVEISGILFISLCRTSFFIDGLFAVLSDDKYPASQKEACAHVLRELLLKSGQKVYEPIDLTKPLPNMLGAIHDKLHDYAKVHIKPLCEILIVQDGKRTEQAFPLQSYTVKRPFGFYRLLLTDVLSDLIVCTPEVLDELPMQIWRVLSGWFLEYRYNNLFHFHFWKIYQLIIRDNHIESQKALLSKYKFVSKMIEHYTSPEPTGNRGFIIVMCNTLRFAAELQSSSGYLHQILYAHDSWKKFVPKLREETLVQQKRYDDLIYLPEDQDEDDEDGGIDLGSSYARSLGFDELPLPPLVAPDSPKKKKNKKKKKKAAVAVAEVNVAESANTGNLDWWKEMVDDLKQEDVKEEKEPEIEDWWKGLKNELEAKEGEKPKEEVASS